MKKINLEMTKWLDQIVKSHSKSVQMANSDAKALRLLFDDSGPHPFGADLIEFSEGGKVELHTHPGSHFLFVTKGRGTLIYHKEKIVLSTGDCYRIPSQVPHAIYADKGESLQLIAIGNDYRPAHSERRLQIV